MNKIGFSLIIIFVISSVILLAELFYVLWRRRLFHRQAPRSAAEGSSTGDASYSKDLLYFYFCLNSPRISRVEPESAPPIPDSGHSPLGDEAEEEMIDVFKLQNTYYGPPRFLFTINEEERENDAESEGRTSGGSRSVRLKEVLMAAAAADDGDQGESTAISEGESMRKECAIELGDEILKAATEDQAAAAVAESVGVECAVELESEMEADTTPFTTPCGSPLYYFTPSASPVHQLRITVPPLSTAEYCEEV